MTTSESRVLIIEDHDLLAQSLSIALEAEGLRVDIATLADRDRDSLLAAISAAPPRLVLLDLDLRGQLGDSTGLIAPLRALGAAVLVVTGTTDRTRLAAAVEAGAVGFVGKNEPFDALLDTITAAVAGRQVLDPNDRAELLAELRRRRREQVERMAPFSSLTPREAQVLAELGNGQSVAALATEWVVSEATVRTQVRSVLAKLGVNSQVAAVAKARKSGWLSAAG